MEELRQMAEVSIQTPKYIYQAPPTSNTVPDAMEQQEEKTIKFVSYWVVVQGSQRGHRLCPDAGIPENHPT